MGGLGPLMNGPAVSAIDEWAVLTYGSEQGQDISCLHTTNDGGIVA